MPLPSQKIHSNIFFMVGFTFVQWYRTLKHRALYCRCSTIRDKVPGPRARNGVLPFRRPDLRRPGDADAEVDADALTGEGDADTVAFFLGLRRLTTGVTSFAAAVAVVVAVVVVVDAFLTVVVCPLELVDTMARSEGLTGVTNAAAFAVEDEEDVVEDRCRTGDFCADIGE